MSQFDTSVAIHETTKSLDRLCEGIVKNHARTFESSNGTPAGKASGIAIALQHSATVSVLRIECLAHLGTFGADS